MKQTVLTILALAALASCTKTELETPVSGKKGEIEVTAGVDGSSTKAYMNKATGLAGASFVVKEGTAVPTGNFSGGTAYTGDVEAATGKVKFATAPMYNTNDENAYFVAYFPGKTLAADAVEWDIDGKTDIMVTNSIWDAGKYSAPIAAGLNFNHQLSRIEVVMKAEAGASHDAVKKAWGNVEKIEFLNAPTKMKYDLSAAPTVTTSDAADFTFPADYEGAAFSAMAVPANQNATANAVAMLAPVTKTATESFMLKVTTAGDGSGAIEVEVPVSLDDAIAPMTAGHTHTVTLTFKANNKAIDVTTSTVDNWTSGTTGGNDMEIPVAPIIEVGKGAFSIVSGEFESNNSTYTLGSTTTSSYNNVSLGNAWYATVQDAIDNEKPFAKFEVAKTDVSENAISLADAWVACKAKAPAGEWRVPRLSEMMLIWLNKTELEKTAGFTAFLLPQTVLYTTATGYKADNTSYWVVQPNIHILLEQIKVGDTSYGGPPSHVRCIREIHDTSTSPSLVIEVGKGSFSIMSGDFNGTSYTVPTPTGQSYNNSSGYVNSAMDAAPYVKFEVALTDEKNSSGSVMPSMGNENICREKAPAGEWRLPIVNELRLMYLNKAALNAIAGFESLDSKTYWSGTEMGAGNTFCLAFDKGDVAYDNTSSHYVRCIREIPIEPIVVEPGKAPFNIVSGEFSPGGSSKGIYTISGTTTTTYNNVNQGDSWWGFQDAVDTEKPFAKFEIAMADEGNWSKISLPDAWAACKAKAPAGKWRLPRVSELMLIKLNKAELEKQTGFTAFLDGYYYSGTGENQSYKTYWYVDIFGNQMGGGNQDTENGVLCHARCIREIP